jgi:hypothetical protein
MSSGQEAPSLIQYACERCKTRFVLPPSRRRLGLGGRLKASGMAVSRTLRFHEGLGSTYDGARRQLLAKMDDDAYQSFVQSFKFCHECRQFVCSECWSASRKTCLGCFAKAAGTTTARQRPPFAPVGPAIPRPVVAAAPVRRRRLRADASLLVMGAAVILLVVELFVILPGGLNNRSGDDNPSASPIAAVDTPTASPTDAPTASPTPSPSPTATPTAIPTAIPTPTPIPTPAATPTRAPTAKPAPPKPTPYPLPTISCSPGNHVGSVTEVCTWARPTNQNAQWYVDSAAGQFSKSNKMSVTLGTGFHSVWLVVAGHHSNTVGFEIT